MDFTVCPYCGSMVAALDKANYCSHHQNDAAVVDSNAYFFSHGNIQSDKHQSRFSIRALSKGYQYYQIKNRVHILNNENFLVINEGEVFENHIDTYGRAEGMVVAFNTNFLKSYFHELNHSSAQLLANPVGTAIVGFSFSENTYAKTAKLDVILKAINHSMDLGIKTPIHYQQHFVNLLDELTGIESGISYQIELIKATKKSTREELYRRLSAAKDFMDAHLNEDLTLQKIAQHSCLSPFHFLRTFAAFFHITPYQYLLAQRLKKAHYLILQGQLCISEVMDLCGFENKRSFQRAFAKAYTLTPCELLKKTQLTHF